MTIVEWAREQAARLRFAVRLVENLPRGVVIVNARRRTVFVPAKDAADAPVEPERRRDA